MSSPELPVPVALALGSNLGDRLAHLREAATLIGRQMVVNAASPVYETPPAYVHDQPAFLNAVLIVETALPPLALLHALRWMEMDLGRQPTFRYGPRAIDIDILLYGDRRWSDAELTIPHARMAEREFVLRPLADIAPDWRHAVTGVTVADMLAALSDATARATGDTLITS